MSARLSSRLGFILLSAGCDLAQGFLFRRPVPLESILYIVRSGTYTQNCETDEERKKFSLQLLPPQTDHRITD